MAAKLSSFRVDSHLVESGEWVFPDQDVYDELEIKTKGFNDRYTDARSSKLRRASQKFGNDISRIPTSTSRDITVECLIAHCLLDVRGIVDDNGKSITFDKFCDLLRSPDYPDLIIAALKAVAVVGLVKASEIEEATANLAKPSKSA